jgi:hypothetical protein
MSADNLSFCRIYVDGIEVLHTSVLPQYYILFAIPGSVLGIAPYVLSYITNVNIVHYYIESYLCVACVTLYIAAVLLGTHVLP